MGCVSLKTLPLVLFLVMALPVVLMPGIDGEGNFISYNITNPLGGFSFEDFMDQAWDYVVNKFSSGVEWVGNGIINILETAKSWHNSVITSLIGPASSGTMVTINLFIAVAYILALMGLVRVWVLVLDIVPIV